MDDGQDFTQKKYTEKIYPVVNQRFSQIRSGHASHTEMGLEKS